MRKSALYSYELADKMKTVKGAIMSAFTLRLIKTSAFFACTFCINANNGSPCPETGEPASAGTALRRRPIFFHIIFGGFMARITVEDCQERVDNRFLLVQMAIKRVHQYREGYPALVESRNKEVVTALREIAAAKIMPDDMSYYTEPSEPIDISKID